MSLPPYVTRGLIHVLCAFVLFAQQAALTHVVWHVQGPSSAYDQKGVQQERDHSPTPEAARLCAFDAAFGQVLSGGPAGHHVLVADGTGSLSALHRSRLHRAADALTVRSRGPPLHL